MSQGKFNQIQAYACYGIGEKAIPFTYLSRPLSDDDVEIHISHCGICGSDIHILDSNWGSSDYPVVAGHEIIGKVTALGSMVTHIKVGDRVGVGAQAGACFSRDCEPCSNQNDAQCPKRVFTYNAKWPDNHKSYGGYAEAIRVQANYAFKIPENLPSEYAAPLMCAGVTVFGPMVRHNIQRGDTVGIVGIGGLGHLAIQFANKLGAEVFAISRSDSKREECLKLGAQHFFTSTKEEIKSVYNKLQYLIVTSNVESSSWDEYARLVKFNGKIILLGIPESPINISAASLVMKNVSLIGSLIGSIQDIELMLQFASEHGVRPLIEKFPMSELNQGIQHVRDGKVRYRAVLIN